MPLLHLNASMGLSPLQLKLLPQFYWGMFSRVKWNQLMSILWICHLMPPMSSRINSLPWQISMFTRISKFLRHRLCLLWNSIICLVFTLLIWFLSQRRKLWKVSQLRRLRRLFHLQSSLSHRMCFVFTRLLPIQNRKVY